MQIFVRLALVTGVMITTTAASPLVDAHQLQPRSTDTCLPGGGYHCDTSAQCCSGCCSDLSSLCTDPAQLYGGCIGDRNVDTSTATSLAPIAADICGVWYKVLYDNFHIYGKDFDPSKFDIDGTDGSGLKKQIQGCGDLTAWSFKFLTDDPNGMQWYASGNLPIGTKACVGRAVVSAGGDSADGCTGAG